jgi:hypothetical protein
MPPLEGKRKGTTGMTKEAEWGIHPSAFFLLYLLIQWFSTLIMHGITWRAFFFFFFNAVIWGSSPDSSV